MLGQDMIDMLLNNPIDVVSGTFKERFKKAVLEQFLKQNDFQNSYFSDPQAQAAIGEMYLQRALEKVQQMAVRH